MKITDIYRKYRINKGLQEHMIRVASVAKVIAEHCDAELDVESIVTACLVHDMGNLIKSKLDSFQEFFEPEGVEYWQEVQADMIKTYGSDEKVATVAIVEDIGLPSTALKFFHAIGNESTQKVCEGNDLGAKIATYSDMRVGPFGVISLKERMDDIRKRYVTRNIAGFSMIEIDAREERLRDIEKSIFAVCALSPEDVTDDSTHTIQSELWNWKIETGK